MADVEPVNTETAVNDVQPTVLTGVQPVPATVTESSTATVPPTTPARLTALAQPTPKRYATNDINKKFLQKNSTTSTAAQAAATGAAAKSGNASPSRPAATPVSSHSRLVTTKLTVAPLLSASPGQGWSRSSSAAPPSSSSTPNPAQQQPTSPIPATATSASSGTPQIPHAGQVIQPLPRGAIAPKKDLSPGRPVWKLGSGNSAKSAAALANRNDFPTAAEVAQVETQAKQAKIDDSKEAAVTAAASKLARAEEADAFRGLHLDPNAHHWDEEEDDDNFLDGVIEFGDGRQYKVEPTDSPSPQKPPAPPVTKEERFAEDFDRSWPRSRHSPEAGPLRPPPSIQTNARAVSRSPAVSQHPPLPSSPSQSVHSPQESSRVLFNERSNRLEPYSNSHRSGGGGPNQQRRPPDPHLSPTEQRNGLPPATNGVQLLQKGQAEGRPRAMGPSTSFQRDAPPARRRDMPPPASIPGQSIRQAVLPPSVALEPRGRRLSNMGPPPVPGRDSSRDAAGRQLPPHLLGGSAGPSVAPPAQRMSSRDSASSRHQVPESPRTTPSSWPSANPQASPAASVRSLAPVTSPVISAPPPVDLNAITKEFMGSSAARAKARRQAEEDAREQEKERARKKLAELDAKFKAAEDAKAKAAKDKAEAEEKTVAEEKKKAEEKRLAEVKAQPEAVTLIEEAISGAQQSSARPSKLQRPPSQDATYRPLRPTHGRQPSQTGGSPHAVQAESWRVNAAPLPPRHVHARSSSSNTTPSFPPPPMETERDAGTSMPSEEGLEVVDFSEMAKFVGVEETIPEEVPSASATSSRPPRPVASDFFGDDHAHTPGPAVRPPPPPSKSDAGTWRRKGAEDSPEANSPPTIPVSSEEVADAGPGFSQTVVSPQMSPIHQRRVPSIGRGPTVSSLDNTMLRIKGALHGMQPERPHHRGQGPSIDHARHHAFNDDEYEERETFDITMEEPPKSPKPAWKLHHVKLPKISTALESPSKKQLAAFKTPTVVRLDVLSWDPPVEGMSKKDFSLNDILFRKQQMHKGKLSKPTVVLPKRVILRTPAGGVKVRIPASPTPSVTRSVVSETSTWRKAVAKSEMSRAAPGLNTTSRSPPPQVSADLPGVTSFAHHPATATPLNFTVANELENSPGVSRVFGGFSSHTNSPETTLPSLGRSKGESSENSSERAPMTPPTHSAWPLYPSAKDSPARGPDPEHLKAVWSQPPEESKLPAVNSLKGIADDLAAIPFTLQEVKSEDGGTPPPSTSAAAPSRMSLHDVTRAFQQVPTGSSGSSGPLSQPRSTPMSPSTQPPPNRQQAYAYSLPPAPNPNMRPPYGFQPPGMMHSASPGPPIMFQPRMNGSPIPRPMQPNGHPAAMYPQPVWMPGPPPPHMHQMQYPPQMMPYSPGGAPPMQFSPGPPMFSPMGGPPNGAHRGRGGMMMSPVIQHVPHPQMYASPAQAHSPLPPPGGYAPSPGRPPGMSGHRPQHSTYTAVPPGTFHPTTW